MADKVNNIVWQNENINTLEKAKFDENASGDVIVRTSAVGTFTVSGMEAFLITTQLVSDTATALPTTALTGRKSVSVVNLSTSETIYIGPSSSVEANNNIGTSAGWPLPPSGFVNFDLAGDVEIWAITSSGKTALIKIKEFK